MALQLRQIKDLGESKYQLMAFLPGSSRELIVESLCLAGVGPPNQLPHWRLFFFVEGETYSYIEVSLWPRNRPGTDATELTITAKFGCNPGFGTVISEEILNQRQELKIDGIQNLLELSGRFRYTYYSTNDRNLYSGCQWWCEVVIGDLEDLKVVSTGAKRYAREYMIKVAGERGFSSEPPSPGQFWSTMHYPIERPPVNVNMLTRVAAAMEMKRRRDDKSRYENH